MCPIRKQREMNAGTLFTFFLVLPQSRIIAYGMELPTVRAGLPRLVKRLWIHPLQTYIQQCVS